MKYFFLEYDRPKGKLLLLTEYDDYESAAAYRLGREIDQRGNRDLELVVLGAEHRTDLEKTHARYFQNMAELSAALLAIAH